MALSNNSISTSPLLSVSHCPCRSSSSRRTFKYPKLEGTHEDHRIKLPSLFFSTLPTLLPLANTGCVLYIHCIKDPISPLSFLGQFTGRYWRITNRCGLRNRSKKNIGGRGITRTPGFRSKLQREEKCS